MRPASSDPQSESRRLNVLLVHGTWGRGLIFKAPVARWCRPDSFFVSQFLDALEERAPTIAPSVSPFHWCGSNSIMRRAEAAGHLGTRIEALAAEGPVLIVGHSHGGNVALQAASKLRDLSDVYVCTLATPFFRLFESEDKLAGAGVLLTLFSIAVCVLAAIVVLLGITGNNPSVLSMGGAMLAGALCGTIGGRLLFRLTINPIPKGGTATPWQLRSRMLCEATAADAGVLTDHLLIIRGIDDEASLSLAAGAVANRLLRVIYALSLGLLTAFRFVGPPVADSRKPWRFFFARVMGMLVFLSVAGKFSNYIPQMGSVIWLVFLTPVLAIFLIPLTRAVFGRELALGAMECDAFFDSVPDSGLATIVTLGLRKDETLSHALYEHPLAARTVANWIAGHVLQGA